MSVQIKLANMMIGAKAGRWKDIIRVGMITAGVGLILFAFLILGFAFDYQAIDNAMKWSILSIIISIILINAAMFWPE